jgi:triphosphatase
MRSGKELELKLELMPQELQRIGAHPALEPVTVGMPATHTLYSIYFDTPDHQLRAHGISLRLRSTDGGQWLQTIKVGDGVINGLSDRMELESEVAKPEPNLEVFEDRKLRRNVARAMRKSMLVPLFETVVKRTTRQLH